MPAKKPVPTEIVEVKAEAKSKEPELIPVALVTPEPPKVEVTVQEPPKLTTEERITRIENALANLIRGLQEQGNAVRPSQGGTDVMGLITKALSSGETTNPFQEQINAFFFKSATKSLDLVDAVTARILGKEVIRIADEVSP